MILHVGQTTRVVLCNQRSVRTC